MAQKLKSVGMGQKPKFNGNTNILTEEQKKQRLQIVDLEIKARYWEAQWKIRFYTLEAEKLQPEYDAFAASQQIKQEEALKRFQQEIEKMNQEAQSKAVADENKDFLSAIVPEEVNPLSLV